MLEILGRRRVSGVLALLVSVVGLLGMSQVAQAGVISMNGSQLVYTMGPADTNQNQTYIYRCGGVSYCPTDSIAVEEDTFAATMTLDPTAAAAGCVVNNGGSYWIALCPPAKVGSFSASLTGGSIDNFAFLTGTGPVTFPMIVNGGDGTDNITTGPGNDTLNGGNGSDTLNGGGGTGDRVDYSSRPAGNNVTVTFDGVANDGAPGAVATSDNSADNVINMEGAIGGAGDDRFDAQMTSTPMDFTGGDGNDTLFGSQGNDTLRGGNGADIIDGNGGTADQVVYSEKAAGVTVALGVANGSGNASDGARDTVSDVERVFGSPFDDVLIGDGGANELNGAGGNDFLRGGLGTDSLIGGDGFDFNDYSDRNTPITGSLDGIDNDGAPGENDHTETIEGIVGSQAGDTLTTSITNTELRGAGGNDTLVGSNGAETLDGGPGDDTMNGNGGVDLFRGGDGNDVITANDGNAETVDCGPGNADNANTDASDNRIGCELPAPPVPPAPPAPPAQPAQPVPTPTPKPLKTMAVTVSYGYFPKSPKKTTKFFAFTAKNLPKGAKVVARCVNAKGKKCKGALGKATTVKKTKKKTLALKRFNKKFPAGSQLEVIVSKSGFKTQIKIVQVRKNKIPNIVTRCQTPGSSKRGSC